MTTITKGIRPSALPIPPVDTLLAVMRYDKATGKLIRLIGSDYYGGKCRQEREMENVGRSGYASVLVNGRSYSAHRVVWRICTGEDPGPMDVDHINGDKTDNRIENLRLVNLCQNLQNMRLSKRNSSGFKGVSWSKQERKWTARIDANGQSMFLGRFVNIVEAVAAVQTARVALHRDYHNHGTTNAKAEEIRATRSPS